MKTSKNGYIRELRDLNSKLIKEIKVKGSLFKYDSKYKTYNNVIGNELLHESSLLTVE